MKKIYLWSILMIVSAVFVSAESLETDFSNNQDVYQISSGNSQIWVSKLKYEPYPVNPGEYFDLWIKAENIGSDLTENAMFELVLEYPFSLDSNEDALKEYGKLNTEPLLIEYKIRVDKDAVEGTSDLILRYKTGEDNSAWVDKTFEIKVEDAQTDFDLVIQEVNGAEISLAIANIGQNMANSVIVKIPVQDSFKTIGTSGQMVGNLEDGDYTLVSFQIFAKEESKAPLEIQIDYTDNIGERRSLIKKISFSPGDFKISSTGVSGAQFPGMKSGTPPTEEKFYQQLWFWTALVVALYIVLKGYKIYNKRKLRKEEKNSKR